MMNGKYFTNFPKFMLIRHSALPPEAMIRWDKETYKNKTKQKRLKLRTLIKTDSDIRCSGKVSMFFFVSNTRRIADWSKLVEIKISCSATYVPMYFGWSREAWLKIGCDIVEQIRSKRRSRIKKKRFQSNFRHWYVIFQFLKKGFQPLDPLHPLSLDPPKLTF